MLEGYRESCVESSKSDSVEPRRVSNQKLLELFQVVRKIEHVL